MSTPREYVLDGCDRFDLNEFPGAAAMIVCRPVALLLLGTIAAEARSEDRLETEIAALALPRIDRGDTVGIVVGVLRDDRSQAFGFGRPSFEDDQHPDGRTIFEIGSVTKVFTSLALADMVREGLVGLDDPVASLLPAGVQVPEKGGRKITLRTLANHTSGLPRVSAKEFANSLKGKDPYADVTDADVYAFLKTLALPRVPGEKNAYSNLGAGLLGHALSLRDRKSYEEMIVARICRPLGMDDTRITLDPSQNLRLARPFKKGGEPTSPWVFDALAGAGALRSTADDMLRFVRANLGRSQVPPRLRSAMDDALEPRTPGPSEGIKLGLGWHMVEKRINPERPEIVFHNGGTGGFRSYVALVRQRGIAVVVLSNSDAEVDLLGSEVLRVLLRNPDPSRARN
jgi:D-alanyl-D-alanine-carboxypeptidase/D-alanyl-D-alanine-endopeptidase